MTSGSKSNELPHGLRMKGGVAYDPGSRGFVAIVHSWDNKECVGEPSEWISSKGQTGVVTAPAASTCGGIRTEYARVGKLGRGTEVEVLDVVGVWCRVRSSAGEGFVHGDFVTLIDASPVAGFLDEREDLRSVPLERLAGYAVQ